MREVAPRQSYPRHRRSRSALWLAVHGWLGLPIWAFLFFICLTGSIATISEEIVWLIDPAARSNPPSPDAAKLSYDRILARVGEQSPGAAVMHIGIPVKDIHALQLYVGRPGGSESMIYVNPYTGTIQGEKSAFDLRQLLRELHGWMLIPFTGRYSLGWYLVSAMSIPLIGSLVTGLVVYKKFWRAIVRPRLRLRQGARIFWGDLHRLVGLWSSPFIAIIGATAIWFLVQAVVEDAGYKLPGDVEPPHVARRHVALGPDRDAVHTVGVDRAIRIAQERFAGLAPAYVNLPTGAYGPIEVAGRNAAFPLSLEEVYISPYDGKVLSVRGLGHRSGSALFAESMRPLHTGDFAGLPLKLTYFGFGILLTSITLSGMLIWTRRTAGATATAMQSIGLGPAWRPWRYLCVSIVLVPALYFKPYLDLQAMFRGMPQDDLRRVPVTVGPWALQLLEREGEEPSWHSGAGFEKMFRIAPCTACVREIRQISISLKRPGSSAYGTVFEGNPYRAIAGLPIRKDARPNDKVWITVEGWDGSMHQAAVPFELASPIAQEWLRR
jgi:uncharacterized iron-regulated membrane protein